MLNIKKEIKRGLAIGLAALTLTSTAQADIIKGDGGVYKMDLQYIEQESQVKIDRKNQEFNLAAAESAINFLKQDVKGIEDINIYIADTARDENTLGLYYHDEEDIVIMNNEDLGYMNEILFTDEYYEYLQMEIEDRELTVFHEVGHYLTINKLTNEQMNKYIEINNNFNFNSEEWDMDIDENIAEDFTEYFVTRYYEDAGYYKDTINQEIDRDQEALNKWIEEVIENHNERVDNIEKEFHKLVDNK